MVVFDGINPGTECVGRIVHTLGNGIACPGYRRGRLFHHGIDGFASLGSRLGRVAGLTGCEGNQADCAGQENYFLHLKNELFLRNLRFHGRLREKSVKKLSDPL